MLKTLFPVLKTGLILKKEALESIRDFPRDFLDVFYKNQSDGIISGCEIEILEHEIIVHEGIVKFKNTIYFSKEKQVINYSNFNEEVILKFVFKEKEFNEIFEVYGVDLIIDGNLIVNKNQMEIGRFKLKVGAILRSTYVNFEDLATEYNTFNIINAKFSGDEASTLNPLVLKTFGNELNKYEISNIDDAIFITTCINSKLVERKVIENYIRKKFKSDTSRYTNQEIYKNLLKIYLSIKNGGRLQESVQRVRPNKIIVD